MRKTPTQPYQVHDPGIYFAPDADSGEQWAGEKPSGYVDLWQYALCQVDSRRGGYVREYDPAGQLVRQHPAEQDR